MCSCLCSIVQRMVTYVIEAYLRVDRGCRRTPSVCGSYVRMYAFPVVCVCVCVCVCMCVLLLVLDLLEYRLLFLRA